MRTTQHALDDLNDFSPHHLRLTLASSSCNKSSHIQSAAEGVPYILDECKGHEGLEDTALKVKLLPTTASSSLRSTVRQQSTELEILYSASQVSTASSSSSVLATYIADQLQELFDEEQAAIANILASIGSHQPSGQPLQVSPSAISNLRNHRLRHARGLSTEHISSLVNRTTRPLKYAPTYHLTISLFTPEAAPSSWDIGSALDDYFTPLLKSLSFISNFTVDTQIQLHASFSPSVQRPQYDPDLRVWTLRGEDLSGFINAAEWPLSPSIGAGPTLNFIIYVPDRGTAPLVVKDSMATSWLIPQWGGVVILNSPVVESHGARNALRISKEALQPALLTFSRQILSFLGAPQSPPSLPLQLKALSRMQAASLLLSASSTMGSLARLTKALPSIAIPETVSTAVDSTLHHLGGTCTSLKAGRFGEALKHAVISEIEAERGFFEKSMVGQVYFPDEHKVAVYLPLLGPVAVPLVMSALKEIKRLWTDSRSRFTGP